LEYFEPVLCTVSGLAFQGRSCE